MLLPRGPVWRSEDVKSMVGFMDEFNRRADEADSLQLLETFNFIVEAVGIDACVEALDQVKKQQQIQLSQQAPFRCGSKSTSAPKEGTSMYAVGGLQAHEVMQSITHSHAGGKGQGPPTAVAASEAIMATNGTGANHEWSDAGVVAATVLHTVTPGESNPPCLSTTQLDRGAALPGTATQQGEASSYIGSESSTSATATTSISSSPSAGDRPFPMLQPATLSWAGVPPVPSSVSSLPDSAARVPMDPVSYPFGSMTGQLPFHSGRNGGDGVDEMGAARSEPSLFGQPPRRSLSTSVPIEATAPQGLASTLEEDGYIPTPRNDGPWHYLGTLPESNASSTSAPGRKGSQKLTGAGSGALPSTGSVSSAGSDDDGSKHRPAAMNFGRYGDHLPYNGRKICRVKNCDGNQRWPDYLCGQHGGGRCRWEGCSLFHQGINSMGLLLCGKHCKAVGATYRRPRPAAQKKERGNGGGFGSTTRKRR